MDSRELKAAVLDRISKTIEKVYGNLPETASLVFPPSVALGDFAFECFPLAKQFRKSPTDIADKVAKALETDDLIQKIQAAGPYINIMMNRDVLFGALCKEIMEKESFCSPVTDTPQRIMVEYLSPNTNKPLHLGHLRNGSLGMAVSNLLKACVHKVIKTNLINNRGIHICKSMLAWQQWGNGETPESSGMKGDKFVGKWYVRYAREAEKDPSLENKARQMLKQWEDGDPDIIRLWEMMNSWVYQGFAETYQKFGLQFDKFYYESDTYQLGKDIIDKGLEKGIFHKEIIDENSHGNVVFYLPPEKFGCEKDGQPKKITVLRHDDTSLYMTQDIGTALLKVNDFNLDRSIYVVGSEQVYHFQCLFEILKALGFSWAGGCYHLSYGMVYLPEGKMKSREGKVVDADDLIEEVERLAKEEICKRNIEKPLSEEEIRTRQSVIAMGAIKFYLLRVRSIQDIHFDPQESISFDGFTGPYCQYAYARISGILRNAEEIGISIEDADFTLLGNEEELQLIQKLIQFPDEVGLSVNDLNPARLAVHIFNTAKSFNQFYNKHQVIHAQTKQLAGARLSLIKAAAQVLKKGLALLNIGVLEKM